MACGKQVSKSDFWFCMIKFLSSEVFPPLDMAEDDSIEAVLNSDIGNDVQDKLEGNVDDDIPEIERNEDQDHDESTNCFESLHANFAPSRRLRPFFFEEETLVLKSTTIHGIDFIVCNCRILGFRYT